MHRHAPGTGFHARASTHGTRYGMAASGPDLLSGILGLARMQTELVCTTEMRAPWAIRFPPGTAHFHVVETGQVWLKPARGRAIRAAAGDLLLMPQAEGHSIADAPGRAPREIDALAARHFDPARLTLTLPGNGTETRLVCGLFHFAGAAARPLLSMLPGLIHIRPAPGESTEWLMLTARFLIAEARAPSPGSALMIARLVELLLIQALRRHGTAATLSRGRATGWLGGLADPRLARALEALHDAPSDTWSVATLARAAGMSRSAFAARFQERVGEPPMRYVARLRLSLAADWLEQEGAAVGQAAARAGYASEAAFSRAFKALHKVAPGALRRQARR